MRNLLLHKWKAKVVCTLIALTMWLYLKNHEEPGFIDQLWTTLKGH